jgi:hypothetical protein
MSEDFLGQLRRENSETMKSFEKQLDELLKLVLEGDLEKVKEHVGTMPSLNKDNETLWCRFNTKITS